tara:strand:+ start:588 stop:806 length:219 start_codon:yes stop_codon:yes gene_type:complete
MSGSFKMKYNNSSFPFKSSPAKQKDTSLTGGVEENLVSGGQVGFWNPQYVPGHQVKKEKKKEITSYKNPRYL